MITRRFIVRGRVQGVGFRFYVSRRAESLGVRGQVWNRSDGGVEIIAQHELEERIAAMEQALWAGPGKASDVEQYPVSRPLTYQGFQVAFPADA